MTMTEAQARRMAFDVRTISDEQLAWMRKFALGTAMRYAPRFAQWLHGWCDTEQAARASGTDLRPLRHCLFVCPGLPRFTDAELAGTLEILCEITFGSHEDTLSEPLDRLFVATVGIAAERLRANP